MLLIVTVGADTSMRLQQAAMSFVQWVFRQANDAQLGSMAPIILSGLLKLLDKLKDGQGKPAFGFHSINIYTGKDINELKSFTYSAIGLLGKRVKVALVHLYLAVTFLCSHCFPRILQY